MHVRFLTSIQETDSKRWNALIRDGYPFLSFEFLAALERHDCMGEQTGWHPRHLTVSNGEGKTVAAVPLFLKSHSYGEFVFDWSWAEAYRRHGLAYYPKLVSAAPFTPATGHRLLVHPDEERTRLAGLASDAVLERARTDGISSLHWLFPTSEETEMLVQRGFLHRRGCQFHWRNRGYQHFDDFLAALSSKKRKNIRRERREVVESGLAIRALHGNELTARDWRRVFAFYCDTFAKFGGWAPLTRGFFQEIGETLGAQVVVIMAFKGPRTVAAALSLRSDDTLYGRYWGCDGDYRGLHFELCYYQGIEYCIEHGLSAFEPGAQGEHKVSRGFVPTFTDSAHWIAHRGFRSAIEDFLQREAPLVEAYARDLQQQTPYREDDRDLS